MFHPWQIRCLTALAAAAMAPSALFGQVEKISETERAGYLAEAGQVFKNAQSESLKEHFGNLKANRANLNSIVNAVRVAKAVNASGEKAGDVVWFSVPAMSDWQRLPDTFPVDGEAMKPVRIVMARGEYEPGSFVVYPLATQGKTTFSLSQFKTADGKILPAGDLDLKVIKVWYQNGNGWYSYFGDTGLKLTPELLLNDEDLIKADTKKVQNYARLTDPKTGKVSYQWLTPKLDFDVRFSEHFRNPSVFQCMKGDFSDAKTLQPVTLNEGEFKQFFLTVHATENTAPGLYSGNVNLSVGGKAVGAIPVKVKVLPFSLPAPRSADLKRDYITMFYNYTNTDMICEENGGDPELAQKQYLATLKDQVRHNQMFHWFRAGIGTEEFKRDFQLLKDAGGRTDIVFAGLSNYGGDPVSWELNAKAAKAWMLKNVGHCNVFLGYGDEPGAGWLYQMRPFFKAFQKEGFKFIIAANDQAFYAAGYFYDFFNTSKLPEDLDAARKWNEVGHAWVAWYATHHVGPENPSFNRRQYGMAAYLAGYSATCNYAHHYGPYNDRRLTYKPMVFAYGSHDGVIDTIQWEGYREAIDDVRYATLLKTLARQAVASDDIEARYAGGIALQFMAEIKLDSEDLNLVRMEMIRHILTLREKLGVK